ncbi:MAG TPA: energy transducer TonB [Thermoanaerobaculia bacterium]
MDDRVGDILARRARLENGAGAAIFFSLLFHAMLTAIAGWSAWHHGTTQSTSVMTIRFAQPQPVAEMTSVGPPPPAAVAATPEPQPKPKPVEKKTAAPSPFGKSTKKPAAEAPPAIPHPLPVAPAQEVPVGGAGVTALEGGDFPYSLYIERMKTLIGSHWLRPQVGDTTTIIYFAIDRDGSIRDARIEAPSGNGLYDRAALRAVLETSPLPPLPFGYNGTYLGVHLKFR